MICIVLGLIFIIYGVVIRMAGSGTGFFMVWFGAGAVCMMHAVISKTLGWQYVPKGLRIVSFAVSAALILLFVVVEGLILSGFRQHGERGLDYIIILGAQIYESGPSIVLKYRLDTVAEYLTDNPQTICIVTGGQGYNEPWSEAQGMCEYLVKQGISDERIILEERARNTTQNIIYSLVLLDDRGIDLREKNVGIVTNDFHVFRGLSIAKKQGMTRVCGIAAGSRPLYLPNNMLREFFGVCKDRLLGNL